MYDVEVGFFLCGGAWFSNGSTLWVLGCDFLVRLGLRYRLLWFWVFGWVFPMGSFGEARVEVEVVMVLGLGWLRGVGMVRKWKW